ncbi:trehalose transporter 1-like protein [Oratosquilla oratoria]|uniref:trehalose transporter 1-like protein n=1 Tax=Oratosquilla oratoria TaxID=337810 RepID=UPI003F7751FD
MADTGSPSGDRKSGREHKSDTTDECLNRGKWTSHNDREIGGRKQMTNSYFPNGARSEEQNEKLLEKDGLHSEKRTEAEGEKQIKNEGKGDDEERKKLLKTGESNKEKKTEAERGTWGNDRTPKSCKLTECHSAGTGYRVSHYDEQLLQQPQEVQQLDCNADLRTPSRNACVLYSAFFREMMAVMTVGGMHVALGCVYAFSGVALPQWDGIRTSLKLSVEDGKWIASIPILTSIPGTLISGVLAESFGCRICLIVGCPILVASWGAIIVATSFWHLLMARIIQGLIIALILVNVSVYAVEIGSMNHRGVLVATTEAMIMFGILSTYALGIFMTPSSIAIVMVAQLLVVLWALRFIPNSPLWLLKKGRVSESREALRYLRGDSYTEEEADEIEASVMEQRKEAKGLKTQLELMKDKGVLKAMFLSICILLAKELTGQYVTVAYTVQIFQMAGSSDDPFWCSFYMGLMKFFPVFICCFLMERMPRRKLLICGQLLGSVGMAIVGLFLVSPKLGADPDILNTNGWIPLFGILVFTFAHMAGVGAVSWALVVELQPSSVRNLSSGIVNSLFGMFQFLIGFSFPDLIGLMGAGGVFLFYSGGGLLGALFVACFVPETKGRTLAQIQRHIKGKGQTKVTLV